MREDVVEANVVMCKCRNSHKTFGIRIEKRTNNTWYCTWAFNLSEQSGSNEGYGSTMISGRVDLNQEYPGCPDCGGTGWVSCGHCKKLTCYNGSDTRFTCAWCGNSGELESSDTFDLSGGGY